MSDTIVIDTPEGIAFFRLLQLRGALRIEVELGLRMGRGSLLAAVNREYGTNFRRKADALAFLDEVVEEVKASRS